MKLWLGLGCAATVTALVACGSTEGSRSPSEGDGDGSVGSGGGSSTGGKSGSGGKASGGSIGSGGDVDASEPSQPDAGADASVDAALEAAPPCPVPPDASLTAKLRVTADDYVSVWFNGVLVDAPDSLWMTLKEYDVPVFLYPGKENVIAVEARNAFEQSGLDRGMIFELEYTVGSEHKFVNSDVTWKVSAPDDAGAAWTAIDYDDSGWATPVSLGKSGIPPWSSVGFNTDAEWLWSYVPDGDPANKPDNEVLHFRKAFYMGVDGTATGEPGRCR